MTGLSRNRQRGATMVETTIVLGIALLLLMAVIDFGRYVAVNSAIKTSAREATRYGSSVGMSINSVPRFTDCDEIAASGSGIDLATDVIPLDFTIGYDHGPTTATFLTCPVGGAYPDPVLIADGDRIQVTVAKTFTFISPLIDQFFGPTTLISVDRRTIQQP